MSSHEHLSSEPATVASVLAVFMLSTACGPAEVAGTDAGAPPPDDGGVEELDAGADGGSGAPDDRWIDPALAEGQALDAFLASVDELTVVERPATGGLHRVFDLRLRVPVDPMGGATDASFEVRGLLFARRVGARERPTVLFVNGYTFFHGTDAGHELASVTGANQLTLEYRYFAGSRPADDPTFEHLTVENGAHDIHRFVQVFQAYLQGPWISTGRSRGGEVALQHRMLYPEDVVGTVAYVTPDVDGPDDGRFAEALRTHGGASCVATLDGLQRRALTDLRGELIGWVGTLEDATWERIGGPEAALESLVRAFPMSFWQEQRPWRQTCAELPDPATVTSGQLFDLLDWTVGATFPSDALQEEFAPYYILAHRQEGFPRMPVEHLADVLTTGAPSAERGTLPLASTPASTGRSTPRSTSGSRTRRDRSSSSTAAWTAGGCSVTRSRPSAPSSRSSRRTERTTPSSPTSRPRRGSRSRTSSGRGSPASRRPSSTSCPRPDPPRAATRS